MLEASSQAVDTIGIDAYFPLEASADASVADLRAVRRAGAVGGIVGRAALEGDLKALAAGGEKGALELVMATHAGMTSEAFSAIASE